MTDKEMPDAVWVYEGMYDDHTWIKHEQGYSEAGGGTKYVRADLAESRGSPRNEMLCDFCGAEDGDVKYFIPGPKATICNKCVDVCNAYIASSDALPLPPSESNSA